MEHLYKAYDMLDKELKDLVRDGDLKNVSSLEAIDKVAHGMKSLKTIIAMCEAEDGYSGYMPNSYDGNMNGRSYARHRDSMGRYSRTGSYRGYSRDEAKDHMIQKLHEMVDEADDDRVRQAIHKAIREVEQA